MPNYSNTIMTGNLTPSVTGTQIGDKTLLDVAQVGSSFSAYEALTFTITGAQSNYDVATEESMFATVTAATEVRVYTDIASTLKLNASGGDAIGLLAGEEITLKGIEVTNLFITTTADTVVRVILLG